MLNPLSFFSKIIKSSNQKELDKISKIVTKINSLEETIKDLKNQLRGVATAGRLDIDSHGLLVLTQDGRISRRIIGENTSIEKEYIVRIEGKLNSTGLKKLNYGLELDGKPLKPAKVNWFKNDYLCFILKEGKKRQIRRMCELVGVKVTNLKRVRVGNVLLGNLPKGQWRYLGDNESF